MEASSSRRVRRYLTSAVLALAACLAGITGPAKAQEPATCSPQSAPPTTDEFGLNVSCSTNEEGPITVLPDDSGTEPGVSALAPSITSFSQLESLIENVPTTKSGIPQPPDGSEYSAREAITNESFASVDIIPNPFISQDFPFPYLAVYHTDQGDGSFALRLAGSFDLATFTRIRELVLPINRLGGSQGTLRFVPGGGFLLAYERQVRRVPANGTSRSDRIDSRIQLRYYPNVLALALGIPSQQRDLPRAFGTKLNDGTPSFRQITWRGNLNNSTIGMGFHYNDTSGVDRQASGTLNNGVWSPQIDTQINAAIRNATAQRFTGNYGQRREFNFQGRNYRIYEAQLRPGDDGGWRPLLYDVADRSIKRLAIRTRFGSSSFGNPATTMVMPSPVIPPDGIPRSNALVVSMFIFSPGSRGGEAGSLIYYRDL